jgi:hypothetical protein
MKYAKDQSDKNLDFNGQAGDGVNRAANKYAGNMAGKTMPMNVGMGPRRGNASSSTSMKGSATFDPKAHTIATASQGGRIDGGAVCKPFAGAPDKINVGSN